MPSDISRSLSTFQLVLRVGSAVVYAPHQLPLPLPGTGRGFVVFLRGGSTSLTWLGIGPDSPVRLAPSLGFTALSTSVDHLWTKGSMILVEFCLNELLDPAGSSVWSGRSHAPTAPLQESE